jgi:hypothetical protein
MSYNRSAQNHRPMREHILVMSGILAYAQSGSHAPVRTSRWVKFVGDLSVRLLFVPSLDETICRYEFSKILWELRYIGAFGLSSKCRHILPAKPL